MGEGEETPSWCTWTKNHAQFPKRANAYSQNLQRVCAHLQKDNLNMTVPKDQAHKCIQYFTYI